MPTRQEARLAVSGGGGGICRQEVGEVRAEDPARAELGVRKPSAVKAGPVGREVGSVGGGRGWKREGMRIFPKEKWIGEVMKGVCKTLSAGGVYVDFPPPIVVQSRTHHPRLHPVSPPGRTGGRGGMSNTQLSGGV
jgi:hypothetical protein